METTRLIQPEYWESEKVDIRLNPGRNFSASGLSGFLSEEEGLRSAVVIPTSGSSGEPKFVVLKKEALLASASAVNQYCEVTKDDIWYGGLSTFHVGGLGIYARAFLSGSTVVEPADKEWHKGKGYRETLGEHAITLTSLTPSHLHDLVESRRLSPPALRGVFLGGGRIDQALVDRAFELGWPIWPTYGMSEASSQVATSREGAVDWLPLLPHWEVKVNPDSGRIQLRGDALFAGYAVQQGAEWLFRRGRNADGWFEGSDQIELKDGSLRFLRRDDDLVKVLGELVSLSGVEGRLAKAGYEAVVFRKPHPRRENAFVAVLEGAGFSLGEVNRCLGPLEVLESVVSIDEFPRTEIGKIDRSELRQLVT